MKGLGTQGWVRGTESTKIPRRDKDRLGCQRNSRVARALEWCQGGGKWEMQPGEQTSRAIVTQSLVGSSGIWILLQV